jgi:hypothetical protein
MGIFLVEIYVASCASADEQRPRVTAQVFDTKLKAQRSLKHLAIISHSPAFAHFLRDRDAVVHVVTAATAFCC